MGVKERGNIVFKEDKSYHFKGRNPVTSIATFDHDSDGSLDFYVGNWFDKTKQGREQLMYDRLYTYVDKKLHDISGALTGYDEDEALTPTFGVSHCDIDGDGRVDILTSSSAGYLNKLWIQESQKGIFKYNDYGKASGFAQDREGELIPKGGGNSTYSLCADYNNDGIMDIVVGEISHSLDSESRDRSSILTGEGLGFPPTFIRNEYISDAGVDNWNQGDQRANWLDVNNDGLVDFLIENSGFPPNSRLILFVQEPDHAYVDMAKSYGLDILNPVGSVYFDFNGDGKLDILVSQTDIRDKRIQRKLYLFENRLKNTGKSISFKLEAKKANANGIGAKVILRTKDGKEQLRWHQVNSGPFPSQNS
ncbi:VCBS repeat-containing protein, partial [Bacteriovorax sp. DB6_IX]|uniref:FG-GAP repeat domain-containing protein n=1 Tax=Bacteriovorax sp. DB6_IX TaxID=1353530 RepID=UPI00038A341C